MTQAFDLVVRGGTVADGLGGQPFEADIAVQDGRIAAAGKVSGSGREEVDARGKLVTPGFIDLHTHYDAQAIWSGRFDPSSTHGVTTVVTGNCGVGFAPCRRADHDLLMRVMEGVEDIPGAVMADGLSWDWETFPEYLDAVAARPHDADVAVLLPHCAVRVYAMGQRGADREPGTDADLAHMRAIAREAVQAGAIGFSTTRYSIFRTSSGEDVPSTDASEEELQAIVAGLADGGGGVIQAALDIIKTGLAQEIDLLGRLAQSSGCPATFALTAPNRMGPPTPASEGWRSILAQVDAANRSQVSLIPQVLPKTGGLVLGFDLPAHPFCHCPSYQPLADLPLAEKVRELRRPEIRARLLSEAPGPAKSSLSTVGRNFEFMFALGDPPDYEPPPEASILAQARRRGVSPEALAYDLMLENDGRTLLVVWLIGYQDGSLDATYEMLQHPHAVSGLSDAGAHLGMICDGSYTTHLLAHGARDRKAGKVPLGAAVRSLSAAPARAAGLLDRGVLAPGYRADLNVIDFDNLRLFAPESTHDLPTGRVRLLQRAQGFDFTFVAGEAIHAGDRPTGRLPGRLVRGVQAAPG